MSIFKIRVDDGPEQTLTVATGIYELAAAAVPALLDLTLPVEIDIWTEHSRFRYRLRDDACGHMVVEHLVRTVDGRGTMVTDLERLELAVRRIHDRRKLAHDRDGTTLNLDVQDLLKELADELELANSRARS